MQLRFRAGLNAKVELTAMADNLLNHWLHLVHLDGEHHIVLGLVLILLGSLLETAPRLFNTVVQNIGETEQYRRLHVAQGELVHHFTQVNLRAVLTGCHEDVALVVDTEIAGTPAVDVVELLRVIDGPFLHN